MDVVWWNVFLQNICHLIGKLRITEALLKPSPLPMYHLNRYKFYLMYPSTIKEEYLDWCRQPRCSDPTTAAAETKSRFRVSIPTPTESSCWLKRLLFLLLLSKRMNITHMISHLLDHNLRKEDSLIFYSMQKLNSYQSGWNHWKKASMILRIALWCSKAEDAVHHAWR
jgi:hypothetical protein